MNDEVNTTKEEVKQFTHHIGTRISLNCNSRPQANDENFTMSM